MKRYLKPLFTFLVILISSYLDAQTFTHADTLRGSNGPGRDWWDATKYDLHVEFNISDSTINGWNNIEFKASKEGKFMQIDLQEPMVLDSAELEVQTKEKFERERTLPTPDIYAHKIVNIKKDGNTYFFPMPENLQQYQSKRILTIYYHGKPRIAKFPPWDGGLIWARDNNNNPWISIACQGLGASVWYPCKDYQGDEPDSAEMHITVPDSLVAVGNGRMRGKTNNNDGTATYDWAVVSPINNYTIIPYIGKYVHFGEVYKGEAGKLDMDYWVLDYNLEKAKQHFKNAPRMMKALEYWFGPYPFYKDGYKLIDAPHLGMEHQSAVAYGNGYQNGYRGRDLSGSGWGLKWDFIIIHESGHEWFGNNITTKDLADMWVHEAFTNYSETLFTTYYYGKKAGQDYITGIRKNIKNDKPIIGTYGVNDEGSGDMYYKGSNMIHNIRQIINNDVLFRQILRGLNKIFYHQTVTSKQVEDYISKQSKIDFSKVFDQYLRTAQVPTLEYKQNGYSIQYRYANCIEGFNMPLKINFKGSRWIKPTTNWQTISMYPEGDSTFSVDPNFYINTKKVE